jgi:hypothetical protein
VVGVPDAGDTCLGLGAGGMLLAVACGFCLLFAMKDKNRVSSWNIKEPDHQEADTQLNKTGYPMWIACDCVLLKMIIIVF